MSELNFDQGADGTLLIRNGGTGRIELAEFFTDNGLSLLYIDTGSGPIDIRIAIGPEDIAGQLLDGFDPAGLLIDLEPYYQSRVLSEGSGLIEGEQAQIFRQYLRGLGREPVADGYQFWWDRIEDGRLTFVKAAQQFIDGQEFNAKADTSGDAVISNEEFVDHMYFNVFGRAPAEGGRTFWMESIDRSSQAVAFTNMLQSPEFVVKTVFTVSEWPYWDEIA